jgi:hypothetical protein
VPTYRVRVTAQLSEWTAVDEARLRAQTGAVMQRLAVDIVRIDLDSRGNDARCAAERALQLLESTLGPSVQFVRSATWVARRRGALGLGRRATGRWPSGGDDDDLAGFREPRRPAPTAGSAAAAIDPDAA